MMPVLRLSPYWRSSVRYWMASLRRVTSTFSSPARLAMVSEEGSPNSSLESFLLPPS